jgi:hypothetical protein
MTCALADRIRDAADRAPETAGVELVNCAFYVELGSQPERDVRDWIERTTDGLVRVALRRVINDGG